MVDKGGGVRSLFKSRNHCQQIPTGFYLSFMPQLLEINFSFPPLGAMVYPSLKCHEDIMEDLTDVSTGVSFRKIIVFCDSKLSVKSD